MVMVVIGVESIRREACIAERKRGRRGGGSPVVIREGKHAIRSGVFGWWDITSSLA